ncbi:MAG TPA: outer membrane beta-barrel domain-containing protein [Myxococcales bacterium]|nr:outer membrane beta-barrel domain-containing protein [Myxococcales bacterium]
MRCLAALLLVASAAAAQQDREVERVHVVESRPFSESNRFELSVFGLGQVNPRFTVHAGIGAELAYHLRENLAVQIGLSYNPISHQSALSEELAAKVDQQPLAASALLLEADALAGVELMPIYGKISIFGGNVVRLGLYVNAGIGVAKTQLQLRPADSNGGRSFGDTGFRPEGALGIGTRIFAGDRLTFRIEVRDRLYSAYVSKVNGCTGQDAQAIRANGAAATGLSPGCSAYSFGSNDEQIKSGAGSAAIQLGQPSSSVINNIALQGGVSWLF